MIRMISVIYKWARARELMALRFLKMTKRPSFKNNMQKKGDDKVKKLV